MTRQVRGHGRFRWLVDLVVLVALYEAYSVVRGLAPRRANAADANAARVLAAEHHLRLDPEQSLNRRVTTFAGLGPEGPAVELARC